MGFRNYIGRISKKDYDKIKDTKFQDVVDDIEETFSPYEYAQELHELGKYFSYEYPKGSKRAFFKDKELQKWYNEDYDLYIVTKKFLAGIIELYRNHIIKYYNNMHDPLEKFMEDKRKYLGNDGFIDEDGEYQSRQKHEFDFTDITIKEQSALFEIFMHIRSMRTEWMHLNPYDLENGPEITKSWKYEYAIFELVRIYKTFDWKNDLMVYYGY